MLSLFQQLHAEGHTVLLVTHDPRLGQLADRLIQLDHGRIMALAHNRSVPQTVVAVAGGIG